jgi:hypothetical protein
VPHLHLAKRLQWQPSEERTVVQKNGPLKPPKQCLETVVEPFDDGWCSDVTQNDQEIS